MTEIEICEQIIAALHDKRNAASKRVNELAGERQRVAYAAYVKGDQAARGRLDKLNIELTALAVEVENIKAAITEADRRLTAARRTVADADAEQRRARVRALLVELEASAPTLDRTGVHPETGRVYRLSDPGARVEVARLVGAVMTELNALGIAVDAGFPSHWEWSRAAWQDLRKAIIDTMSAGWPAPAQRLTLKERDSFTALLSAFARIVRSNLGDQTERAA
jgi:plasmid stabilization system protein ParE